MEEAIIQALRDRCPSFGGRVAGAAQFKMLPETAALAVPCAFVMPLDDSPHENVSQTSVRQHMTDSFAVIVALSNLPDERGQAAAHNRRSIRAEIWAALLNWAPLPDYRGIQYEGGNLLSLDRARMWYQFEFGAPMEIGLEDGYHADLDALSHLDGVTINVDYVSPFADPNLQSPGPDGRTEVVVKIPKTGVLP